MKHHLKCMLILLVLSCNNTVKKGNETKLDSVTAIKKAECMESILKRDFELGDIRNHATEQISLSQTIDNYTNSIKSLDYSNCPDTFTIAFHEHIGAWLDVKQVSDKYPEMRGELHAIFSELEKKKDSLEFKALQKALFDTWETVDKIVKN